MIGKLQQFIKDEEGQTSTEYILLVVLVAMIVIKVGKNMDDKLTGITTNAFGKIDHFVETMTPP